MIAHGCDPDVAKNLFYSSVSFVDVLPVMGPRDWHSKKVAYIAPNNYNTAMSQIAQASTEMLEELPSIFQNFRRYFCVREAHHFFQNNMEQSNHPVMNTEKVVYPITTANKFWDTDHQIVAVRQACLALSAAIGLDFHHSNIKHFDGKMPISASMKRRSEERLDAAISRLEMKEQKEEEDESNKKEEARRKEEVRLEEVRQQEEKVRQQKEKVQKRKAEYYVYQKSKARSEEERLLKMKICHWCSLLNNRDHFSQSQWVIAKGAQRRCLACTPRLTVMN